jgi:hypothetical protein
MTQHATRPVVSGRDYPVLEVAAREPVGLDDFVGATWFTLDLDGDPYPVYGVGREVEDGVRFYQKDTRGVGRDIRVWAVRRTAGGRFSAEHVIH